MGYRINLKNITLDDFKTIIRTTHLIPSWEKLNDELDNNIDRMKKGGIENLDDVISTFKSKKKLEEFSARHGIDPDYLTIVNRMVKGYYPKPMKITDFKSVAPTVASKLATAGIKKVEQLYDALLDRQQLFAVSDDTGLSPEILERLHQLADLTRIRWVNHTFAEALHQAGYDCVEKVANADASEMYQRLKEANATHQFYKGTIGEKDLTRCIESAQLLDVDVQLDSEYSR